MNAMATVLRGIVPGIVLGVLVSLLVRAVYERLVLRRYMLRLERERLEREERRRQGWAQVHAVLGGLVSQSKANRVAAEATRLGAERMLLEMPRQARRELAAPIDEADLLDEIPGIGRTLAERLLERFESTDGIRRASADALVEVKGIGSALAQEIKRALR